MACGLVDAISLCADDEFDPFESRSFSHTQSRLVNIERSKGNDIIDSSI